MRELNQECLNKLPKKYGIGVNKNKLVYDWINCIGYKIKFIYNDIEGEVEIIDYNLKKCILMIKYLDKKPFNIVANSFLKCYLGKLLGKKTSEFKIEIGKIFKDDKRDIVIIDRKHKDNPNNKEKFLKWYQYKCNKCEYENGWIIESNLFSGVGCACCGFSKILVEGINDIPTTTPWMVKYFQGGYDEAKLYTKCSKIKIYPICPDCGKIRNKTMSISNIYKNHSIGCSCGDGQSYPNKFTYNLLLQTNVIFEREYSPDWVKPKRYDFWFKLNNQEYILEMDGGFHDKYNKMNGETIAEVKRKDTYKDIKALENNIKVIRIDAKQSNVEFIKENILKSEMNNLFNLKLIDWTKCDEFATSNLCKKVCDIKNKNSNITVNEISEMVKLERSTIINYLNKGTKLKWCNYNGKEESRKTSSKNGIANGRQVEIYKDENSLGIFKSCSELERSSEVIFGIKLFQANISKVCLGIWKQYKGYTFKYI